MRNTLIVRFAAASFLLILLASYGCETTTDTPVGSSKDTQIPNTALTVDSTYMSGSYLYARGTVKNNGTDNITTPWYVECQFYSDSTYTYKLGGSNTQINVPLSGGQGTFWTIGFSSSNVDVRQFPRFRVNDLRAIYKN